MKKLFIFSSIFVFINCAVADDGILPIPDYSESISTRNHLAGDFNGSRTELAKKGVQFEIDSTQSLQSIVDGGTDSDTKYGGSFDYNANFDLMRMGILPGALISFRAESRIGSSVNGDSGSLSPVNTDALFPLTSKLNDDVPFTITNLNYTQFLSKNVGFLVGKFDTADGDLNEFASGRGTTQFMNGNFLFNPVIALHLPYSTLGGGIILMPIPNGSKGGLTIKSLLIQTTDSSESDGFDNFDDGLTWLTEASTQYRVSESKLPGGQNLGFLYSFDQDFRKIGGRLVIPEGQGLNLESEDSTWALYWSAWQYLIVRDPNDKAIDLANKMADHQGFGFYSRAGLADQDTNPIKWSFSVGVGGRGVMSRDNDSYGVGYYFSDLQSTRFTDAVGVDDAAQGFELYYSVGITPAAQFIVDLQTIDSVLPNADEGIILGGRLHFVL